MTDIVNDEFDATDEPTLAVSISVDHNHCHLYAICQHEAPEVFRLHEDRRLVFDPRPPSHLHEQVRSAARLCPMQAIIVEEAS
jgi:ferredoxin